MYPLPGLAQSIKQTASMRIRPPSPQPYLAQKAALEPHLSTASATTFRAYCPSRAKSLLTPYPTTFAQPLQPCATSFQQPSAQHLLRYPLPRQGSTARCFAIPMPYFAVTHDDCQGWQGSPDPELCSIQACCLRCVELEQSNLPVRRPPICNP